MNQAFERLFYMCTIDLLCLFVCMCVCKKICVLRTKLDWFLYWKKNVPRFSKNKNRHWRSSHLKGRSMCALLMHHVCMYVCVYVYTRKWHHFPRTCFGTSHLANIVVGACSTASCRVRNVRLSSEKVHMHVCKCCVDAPDQVLFCSIHSLLFALRANGRWTALWRCHCGQVHKHTAGRGSWQMARDHASHTHRYSTIIGSSCFVFQLALANRSCMQMSCTKAWGDARQAFGVSQAVLLPPALRFRSTLVHPPLERPCFSHLCACDLQPRRLSGVEARWEAALPRFRACVQDRARKTVAHSEIVWIFGKKKARKWHAFLC